MDSTDSGEVLLAISDGGDGSDAVEITTLAAAGLMERAHLQEWVVAHPIILGSSLIAEATGRPDKVVNMHFFNPALVMKLVEVVKGPHVSADTAEATMDLARRMEKTPILLRKEIYGFVVNRILAALNKASLFLLDQGVASAEDIDTAVENGLGHPMGPFRLLDLTGVDLNYLIALSRYQETQDSADIPSPTLARMYALEQWGRKTGRGFYTYD